MKEIRITKENFEKEVLKADRPVLLDFWASWCGPCRILSPVISDIADELDGKVKVGKVNVDEEMELAAAFGVSGIPMLAVVKNGKLTNRAVGVRPKEQIVNMI